MADRTDVEAELLKRTAEKAQLLDDYAVTFTTEAGARVLEDLRRSAFYYRTTCERTMYGVDHLGTVRNEGARQLVLGIEDNVRKGREGRARMDGQTHAITSTQEGSNGR